MMCLVSLCHAFLFSFLSSFSFYSFGNFSLFSFYFSSLLEYVLLYLSHLFSPFSLFFFSLIFDLLSCSHYYHHNQQLLLFLLILFFISISSPTFSYSRLFRFFTASFSIFSFYVSHSFFSLYFPSPLLSLFCLFIPFLLPTRTSVCWIVPNPTKKKTIESHEIYQLFIIYSAHSLRQLAHHFSSSFTPPPPKKSQ